MLKSGKYKLDHGKNICTPKINKHHKYRLPLTISDSWFTSSEYSMISTIIPLSLWFKIISPLKSLLKWGLDRVIDTFESKKKSCSWYELQYSTSAFCYAEGFESTYFPFHSVHHSPSKAYWVRPTLYSSKPSKSK